MPTNTAPTMTTRRLKFDDRRAALLALAVKIARKEGLTAVNSARVARDAKVTRGLMSYYFQDVQGLRTGVLEIAGAEKDVKILTKAVQDGFDINACGATREIVREARRLAKA